MVEGCEVWGRVGSRGLRGWWGWRRVREGRGVVGWWGVKLWVTQWGLWLWDLRGHGGSRAVGSLGVKSCEMWGHGSQKKPGMRGQGGVRGHGWLVGRGDVTWGHGGVRGHRTPNHPAERYQGVGEHHSPGEHLHPPRTRSAPQRPDQNGSQEPPGRRRKRPREVSGGPVSTGAPG